MPNVFWGLKLEPGKRYSTTVESAFHISCAALDSASVNRNDEIISVMLEVEHGAFILCNLSKDKQLQSQLDLNFMSGERITLSCKGQGVIHLSGYLVPDDDDDDLMDGDVDEDRDEEEIDEDDIDEEIMKSIKQQVQKNKAGKREMKSEFAVPSKKIKIEEGEDSSEEDEDDDDDDIELDEDADESTGLDMNSEEDDDEDDDDDGDEDDEDEDEEVEEAPKKTKIQQKNKQVKGLMPNKGQKQQVQTPKQQTPKQNQQTPKQNQQGAKQNQQQSPKTPNGTAVTESGKKKRRKSRAEKGGGEGGEGGGAGQGEGGKWQTLNGGVSVKELRVGTGSQAQQGKQAQVYYTGRLKSNNKVFDSVTSGTAFRFKVGKGEVIKAWDIGVSGMKVGGKRLITCPPHVAYGAKGAPPSIPPNSTLVFEVELKGVS